MSSFTENSSSQSLYTSGKAEFVFDDQGILRLSTTRSIVYR